MSITRAEAQHERTLGGGEPRTEDEAIAGVTEEDVASMSRRELQTICKRCGIRANMKNVDMRAALTERLRAATQVSTIEDKAVPDTAVEEKVDDEDRSIESAAENNAKSAYIDSDFEDVCATPFKSDGKLVSVDVEDDDKENSVNALIESIDELSFSHDKKVVRCALSAKTVQPTVSAVMTHLTSAAFRKAKERLDKHVAEIGGEDETPLKSGFKGQKQVFDTPEQPSSYCVHWTMSDYKKAQE